MVSLRLHIAPKRTGEVWGLFVSLAVLEVSLAVCLIPLPSAGATENNSQLVIETHNRRETQLKEVDNYAFLI